MSKARSTSLIACRHLVANFLGGLALPTPTDVGGSVPLWPCGS